MSYECNCIYCRETEEAEKIERRNKRLAKLEKQAMERLLNPLEPDEDDSWYYESDDDDEYECDICGEDLYGSSHYHCYHCGQSTGMMGHSDPHSDKYTCDPWDVWEWKLVEDLYGA